MYHRVVREVAVPFPHCDYLGREQRYNFLRVTHGLIGFCGRIYPVAEVWDRRLLAKPAFCYCVDEVDDYVKTNVPAREAMGYDGKPRNWRNGWQIGERRKDFAEFFAKYQREADNYACLFEQHRAPVWTAEQNYDRDQHVWRTTLRLNECLNHWQFYRVKDPYQAFQAIQQWLSNQAAPERPIPHIPDEILAEAKGFTKHSFRKDPSKKR